MGNAALPSHEDLAAVRGWTRQQIDSVLDGLRGKKISYSLTREDFSHYFGGRNREANVIFSDLDTDMDGKVDVFEIFVVFTLWSGTSWVEKQELLFKLFDLMQKGFLKVHEVALMATVLVQTLRKFVKVDPKVEDPAFASCCARKAMPPNETRITLEQFRASVKDCEPLAQLQDFVEAECRRRESVTGKKRLRQRMASMEQHANRLEERIARLQAKLPELSEACTASVSAWGRKKQWDFTMQNLRQVVMKLKDGSDSMHSTLAELELSVQEDEMSGGRVPAPDAEKRFNQEKMMLQMESTQRTSATDFREATSLLNRLLELTEPTGGQAAVADRTTQSLGITASGTQGGNTGAAPLEPQAAEQQAAMKRIYAEMQADVEDGGFLSLIPPLSGRASETPTALPALANASGADPTAEDEMVAIADFEPPPSHDTQLLELRAGDLLAILGQDGRGWWYGRKRDGKEGWFPMSYVQMKSALTR